MKMGTYLSAAALALSLGVAVLPSSASAADMKFVYLVGREEADLGDLRV